MGKSIRKINKNKRKKAEAALSSKLNKFDQLGDKCLVCFKEFDKTNKTMVTSWHVIINPTRVKLYCPTCWDRAKGLIDSLVKDGTETNANDSD